MTTEFEHLESPPNFKAPLYSPLDHERSEFRLLDLFPGEQQAPLRCSLRVEPFRIWSQERSQWMVHDYKTVSYCWGDPSARETITVNEINVSVPKSSAAALRCMRLETELRTLWIDAICINQNDIQERGHQVQMMRRIYSTGLLNLIYLGASDMQEASDSIMAIREDNKASKILEKSRTRGWSEVNCVSAAYNVDALISLFQHDWFKRVWVVQEAALAGQNWVHSGATVMNLLDITRAATILRYNSGFVDARLSKLLNPIENMNHLVDPEHGAMGPGSTVIDPIWLAYMLRDREATQPVDRIYAMLGLFRKADIIPDYSKPPADVYMEAARWMIQSTRSLGILRLAEEADLPCPEPNDGCSRPSWAPDFGHQFDQKHGQGYICFWFNSTGDRAFDASESHGWSDDPTSRILPARGVRLGAVCSEYCPGGQRSSLVPDMVADWLVCMEYEPFPESSFEEVLAMTLCAGATIVESLVETSDAIQGLRALREFNRRGVDPNTLKERHAQSDDSGRAIDGAQQAARTYEEALNNALKARHLFLTETGLCGLGPRLMQMGDIAVVLYGLRWPAILRSVGSQWRFLGLAYVHGAMNGEAIAQRQGQGGQVDEVFEII